MSIYSVAAVVEMGMHMRVGYHFLTSVLEPDFDTAGPDTQLSAAAAVQC